MASHIRTKVLVLSDTHGDDINHKITTRADVAVHCGDLTEESKLAEFQKAIQQLKAIDAPLKLVIAGNHDFTLDDTAFEKIRSEVSESIDDASITSVYGAAGEAKALLQNDDTKAAGIAFLNEGTHTFALGNGALLTVYASPYTPSTRTGWGFQYNPQQNEHEWAFDSSVDVVMTHGPPRGVLDYTESRQRAGSPRLFAAIARAKPGLHCFGHIHEAWGAKLVTWRPEISEQPSHFTDIDNEVSALIENRATLRDGRYDTQDIIDHKAARRTKYADQGYRDIDTSIKADQQTLFVNAAIEGMQEGEQQLPWLVYLDLPVQQSNRSSDKKRAADEEEEPVAKRQCCSRGGSSGNPEEHEKSGWNLEDSNEDEKSRSDLEDPRVEEG